MAIAPSDSEPTLQRRAGCYDFIDALDMTLRWFASKGDTTLRLESREGGDLRTLLRPGQFLYIGHGYQEVRLILAVDAGSVRVEPLESAHPAGSPVFRPAQYQLGAA